jgi:hypothetical protein
MKFLSSVLVFFVLFVFVFSNSKAEEDPFSRAVKSAEIHAVAYINFHTTYSHETNEFDYNEFELGRAYLTVKNQITDFLKFRMTLDIYEDDDGQEERLKYLYAGFRMPEFLFITDSWLEVGLTHTPWLDFEEDINFYRMQGKMFMERAHLFNSADFGATWLGLFGGEMSKEYQKEVNHEYPGRYGSFAVGVYNGGGYYLFETNRNKTFQSRVTLRPIPDIIPGLQFSWLGIIGQGTYNEDFQNNPEWNTNAAMVSYENPFLTLAVQGMTGRGNYKGNIVDNNGESIDYSGYSVFAEGRLGEHLRLMSRFDNFTPEEEIDKYAFDLFIAGIGWDFYNRNMLLLNFQNKVFSDPARQPETMLALSAQVNF